ncbi:MAG: PAS domain S-box protein, partial [Candidatus Omnitrophota bacterium]
MKNISFTSLRARLMLLVLAVIVPMLGLIVYAGIEDRNEDRLEALDKARRLARNASTLYEHTIMETRQILFTLSQMPQFRQQDSAACSKIFANLLKQTQNYSGFSATKPNGEVFASAPSLTKPVSFADRPWFQRLVQTRGFVIGEYLIGRLSGKPTVVLGYPVLDHTGQLIAAFVAGLDLENLQRTLLKINLPDGANLNVIDSNGTILLRFPDPEKFVGKKMSDKSIVKAMLTKKEGVMEQDGLDGVPRLFGYTTVGSGIEAIHISVSIPKQVAYADLKRRMIINLTLLGLVSVLALLGVWLFGKILFISPVNRLIDVTKQLAGGDLTVRTGRSTDTGELGLLALNFDQMAGSLQRHEEERKLAEDALRVSEEKYRIHFENVSDVVFSFNREFRILSISPSLERVLGYKPEEFIGKPFAELNILSPEYLEKSFSDGMRVFAGENVYLMAYELIARDGTIKYMEFSSVPLIRDGQVEAAVSVARDITKRKRSEEALLESEELYRSLVENIDFGVTMIDKDYNILMTNHVLSKWFNKPIREFVGKSCFREFEKRQAVCQHCPGAKAMDTGQPHQVETQGVRDDGSRFSVLAHAFPLFYPDGTVKGFNEVVEDITERKLADERLKRQFDQLAALRAIDMAITASLDIRVTFNVFLEQAVA